MLAILLDLIESEEERSRFELLYHKYERLMFFVANQRLGDAHLAEDAVNEACIRIINHFDEIEEIDCPRTKRYVVVIVKNICNDMYAKQQRRQEITSGDSIDAIADNRDDQACSSQDAFFQKYEVELIRKALQTLPDIYRDTLYLSAVEGKSREKIAQLTGSQEETVKKRLYRARRELKRILEEWDGRE